MKDDYKRLLNAAIVFTSGLNELERVTNDSTLARFLGESAQTVSNWKRRGLPRDKIVLLGETVGVNPSWLQSEKGPMYADGKTSILPVEHLGNEHIEMGPIQGALFKLISNPDMAASLSDIEAARAFTFFSEMLETKSKVT